MIYVKIQLLKDEKVIDEQLFNAFGGFERVYVEGHLLEEGLCKLTGFRYIPSLVEPNRHQEDESLTPEERNGGVEGLMNEINRMEGR